MTGTCVLSTAHAVVAHVRGVLHAAAPLQLTPSAKTSPATVMLLRLKLPVSPPTSPMTSPVSPRLDLVAVEIPVRMDSAHWALIVLTARI